MRRSRQDFEGGPCPPLGKLWGPSFGAFCFLLSENLGHSLVIFGDLITCPASIRPLRFLWEWNVGPHYVPQYCCPSTQAQRPPSCLSFMSGVVASLPLLGVWGCF